MTLHALGSRLELFAGEMNSVPLAQRFRLCGSSSLPSHAGVRVVLVSTPMRPERVWHKFECPLAPPEDLMGTLDCCCNLEGVAWLSVLTGDWCQEGVRPGAASLQDKQCSSRAGAFPFPGCSG